VSRIEELEKRLAADPNSRMFVQLAEEYRKARLLDQAIDVCEKGLKKHPGYPSARVALGRALLEAGSFDRAKNEFEAVLKQVPDNILAIKFLGETYHRLGRFDEALQKYNIARTLAPEDTELEGKMQEVQAEMAGGPKPAAAPAPPPPPSSAPSAAVHPAPRPVVSSPSPPAPRPVTRPVAAAPPVHEAPPLEPEPEIEREDYARPVDDLPPIPLVEVDEPMILEDRFGAPTPRVETPAPPPPPSRVEAPPPPPRVEPPRPEPELKPAAPVAAPVAAPAAPVAPAAAAAPDIQTPTMAEIYASQGHFHQAIAVYQRLLERNPADAKYRDRIDELKRLSTSGPDPDQKTIQVLEQWLEAIRKSRGA
jgi:tetratricopeptide (TPR) repeat protein